MKFTVKGVCFTLLIICSGFLLLILPSFVMGHSEKLSHCPGKQ